MKKTPWFSGYEVPARDGVYERKPRNEPPVLCRYYRNAWYYDIRGTRKSQYQELPWRGVFKS
jgi:hypothetical protein